jgi:hypothetical protein
MPPGNTLTLRQGQTVPADSRGGIMKVWTSHPELQEKENISRTGWASRPHEA